MPILNEFDDAATCLSFDYLEGIGPIRGRKVISLLSSGQASIADFVDAIYGVSNTSANFSVQIAQLALANAVREIEKSEAVGIKTVPITSGVFPKQLSATSNSPLALFVIGDISALNTDNRVAVVGTRKPSPKGASCCDRITRSLARAGVTVVSGLALGCDTIVHEATLGVMGITVAVMPCGLDVVTPSSNKKLAEKIVCSSGALVSEYRLGTTPQKRMYVQRNRIQSGLSDAVIVVEAAIGSGTLGTAKHCIQQGRPLYVVHPDALGENADASGNQSLISAGHRVLSDGADVSKLIREIESRPIHQTDLLELLDVNE
jgi:DNA processing protein